MARKKTYSPEMGEGDMSDFFRNLGKSQGSGTIVQGLSGSNTEQPASFPGYGMVGKERTPAKPVLGFLYSISNNGTTEYWPLQLGRNVIGSSPNSDIVLPEATVSALHATIVIQKQKNPEKVVAYMRDEGSTNGTMLNGTSVGIALTECKFGDKITFGDNYVLLLLLLDPKELGLRPADNFISIQKEPPLIPEQPVGEPDGTVDIDGNSGFDGGGTQAL